MNYDDTYCETCGEASLMPAERHSYVRFFPSDWVGGTARLPRMHRSVYFDICCYIWDTAKPVPPLEARLMLSDVPEAEAILEDLILMGKVERLDNGCLSVARAMDEAERAFDQWEKRSFGGKGGRNTVPKSDPNTDAKTVPKSASTGNVSDNQNQNQSSPNGEQQPQIHDRILEVWNRTAESCGLSKVVKLTEARKKSLNARLKEFEVEQIVDAIESIETSSFLLGNGERGFKATLDFVLQAKSLPKLIEGDYHGRTGKRSPWLDA